MNKNQENIEIKKLSELLKESPTDDGTFYSSLYDLYVLIVITKGVNNINHGNGISLEELDREMQTLYESTNRKFGSTGTY